eukprot:CAMPEP_0114237914 /NCGR_PEP_ID=MMETSP0058-20121206/7646_1 /TAXON_ID=36894 /ORGANISM="Pyramimonas parkeae, CCMP726" /LENGTH=332 /DNA_ID=CAMNT_0001349991 /DNA_START=27 /DNA_END=1025 /DNA_ORIENTATION=+
MAFSCIAPSAKAYRLQNAAFAGVKLRQTPKHRAPLSQVARRGLVALAGTDTWKLTAAEAAAAEPEFSILTQALENTGLSAALASEGPFTVFAPTNAAFDKFCEERQLSKVQLLELLEEQLPEIIKYHVVAGESIFAEDLAPGELESVQGAAIDITQGKKNLKVDGAGLVGTDLKVANGVIHAVDEVLVPPFVMWSKVRPMDEILGFKGWAAETINGRLAMLGFVYAVVGEFTEGKTFLGQMGSHFGGFAFALLLWTFASMAPALGSNMGYTADPASMAKTKEWKKIMKGGPWPAISGIMTPALEKNLGKGAMVGILSLILIELVKGSALFAF